MPAHDGPLSLSERKKHHHDPDQSIPWLAVACALIGAAWSGIVIWMVW